MLIGFSSPELLEIRRLVSAASCKYVKRLSTLIEVFPGNEHLVDGANRRRALVLILEL